MKFENTKVDGWENAIIGMRLPMCRNYTEAKEKCDSKIGWNSDFSQWGVQKLGEKDLDLMKRLIKADENASGQPNSKFLRMIHVQVAITAPLYWWKEADTYKILTVTNSTSTMHKLASTPITLDCFELTSVKLCEIGKAYFSELEKMRQRYNELIRENPEKAKKWWKALIQLLPESWLQTRMFDCNYATLRNIYRWRKNHKLVEWHKFCEWIENLPYSKELLTNGE